MTERNNDRHRCGDKCVLSNNEIIHSPSNLIFNNNNLKALFYVEFDINSFVLVHDNSELENNRNLNIVYNRDFSGKDVLVFNITNDNEILMQGLIIFSQTDILEYFFNKDDKNNNMGIESRYVYVMIKNLTINEEKKYIEVIEILCKHYLAKVIFQNYESWQRGEKYCLYEHLN